MSIDEKNALELRKKIYLTGIKAPNAHLASAFSLVEILYTLYCKNILKYDIKNVNNSNRDKLILSKGHGSLALYSVLNKCGFFSDEVLASFCQIGSVLGGEPNSNHIPGVEASTGSLGHGLSIGVGIALAEKINKTSNKVYVILGDGECQEGTIWEAAISAKKYQLDNLIVILDCNRIQKMGLTEEIMGEENWQAKFESFGFICEQVDGHNIDELYKVFIKYNNTNMPKLIIANTIKGKGVSIMENNPSWHWRLPNKRETKIFEDELKISNDKEVI